ncbi:hypothetical protein [Nannocystis sp.]|uniref:hypothetical protein n=1 Tax=Nannocystis sp. TaxID=1962667 RepID=UPI002424B439|nr:hypothetical protein [Nannocystis sp.]MBK7830029.1 hypothetical protein [Nannocystis sp.]MBK9752007.1 hypothetical protein [Nannocystis sp.]
MILERRPNDFPGRNMLLQITLGLLSMNRTLDELLAQYAPPRDEVADAKPEPAQVDEGALFVLGLIAFARRLQTAVEAVPPPLRVVDPQEPSGPLKGLLR